jgi:transcriptional regulator NrdR family protein
MSSTTDIIKRHGKRPTEKFRREKLHKSIVAACLSVKAPEGQAETTAHSVCEGVIDWLRHKTEVTSNDIRLIAAHCLESYHPDAAYLYEQNRITI